MTDASQYNPLDKTKLGASVADALLGRKPRKLHGLKSFDGVGIYALYYQGRFAPYQRLSEFNRATIRERRSTSARPSPKAAARAASVLHRHPAGRCTGGSRNMPRASRPPPVWM